MNDNPTHVIYREVAGPDGYVTTKVPLKLIRFLDLTDLRQRILHGSERERFAHYCDLIRDGHYANGLPIVYRSPKGGLFASDLRHSDVVLYAEQNIAVAPGVPRNAVHPLIGVKIIEVASRDDIARARAAYLEASR
jgi:hypothetical protein